MGRFWRGCGARSGRRGGAFRRLSSWIVASYPCGPRMDRGRSVTLQSSLSKRTCEGVSMRPPIKLSAIDQEHLQELYNEAAIPREELPYTAAYDQICQGFQDRTFKNAHPEQVFAALLKYVRSGSNSAGEPQAAVLDEEQIKRLKAVLPRHAKGGKMVPYSDEFEA